jgi:MFS family permease
VQLTISSYLFGFAAGQIFYGPLSDRLGRRPILCGALVLYALEPAKGSFSLRAMGALYRSVAVHRGFLANLVILTAAFVGLFAWISGAPVVMQSATYGLTPFIFGVDTGFRKRSCSKNKLK